MITHLGPETNLRALVRDAQAAGRTVHVVPAGDAKGQTLERFAQVLGFPDWFGHNLDALADCLHDVAAKQDAEWDLVWDGTAYLRKQDERTYAGVASVLEDVAAEHEGMRVTVIDR